MHLFTIVAIGGTRFDYSCRESGETLTICRESSSKIAASQQRVGALDGKAPCFKDAIAHVLHARGQVSDAH